MPVGSSKKKMLVIKQLIPFLSFSGGNTGMQKANVVQYNVIFPSTRSKHASLEVKTDPSQHLHTPWNIDQTNFYPKL